jgi:hypothetical protein
MERDTSEEKISAWSAVLRDGGNVGREMLS